MAGQGIKLFASGDVLSAAEINGYLMDQSVARFASTTARDLAFGGENQPTLSEGRICYIDASNLIQFYDGTQWQDSAQFTVGDGTVTTVKLADDAVTSAKIADGAITAAHIADGTIIAADIADGSVTSAKILDGTIVDADINAAAAIAHTKLANATAGQVLLGTTTTGVVTATTVSGDVTITGAGVTAIASGVIVDADVNAAAAIALSKLASGTSGQIIVHSSGGVPTATTVSGDVTIDSTGDVQIAADKIVNADINSSAAIAYSKLSLSGAITTTDLAAGAARSGFRSPIVAQQGATHTIAASDVGGLVVLSSCTSVVIPTSDGTFTVGDRIDFLQTGSQVVTFSATAPQIVGGFDAQTKLGGQYAVATLVKYAANTWVLVGNITS
jgi:hypothetical protein